MKTYIVDDCENFKGMSPKLFNIVNARVHKLLGDTRIDHRDADDFVSLFGYLIGVIES